MYRPKLISVYSGWGGGDWGFHKAGFDTLLAVDNDKHSRKCFQMNFPGVNIQGWDLKRITGKLIMEYLGIKMLDTDVLLMSPPCTDASRAGKCNPFGELNVLMLRCFRWLVKEIKPKVFVFENVDNLPCGRMHVLYQMLCREIAALDEYHVGKAVLNSLHYNTPSSRNRLIIIGVHKSVGKIPSRPDATTSDYEKLTIRGALPHVEGILYGYDFDKFKPNNEFANTITKTPNIMFQVNGEIRFPTTPELLTLTGYPPDWKYEGSDTQLWNRIGNSFMPQLSYAIAKHIRENILCI